MQSDIASIITHQEIRPVFQPIVHLDSGTTVGFEALMRGPEGSALESAPALLDAAASKDLLGALDWAARIAAIQAIMASALPAALSWFINTEPLALDVPCPEPFRSEWAHAQNHLRIMLEIVERGALCHPLDLLNVCQHARAQGWGVALDDVAPHNQSLALMPVLRPDVVKLDMLVLHHLDEHAAARTAAAACAYAERCDAVVLAEGIETAEHAQLAQVFGATYGQGYYFGKPGPLPETLSPPLEVIPLRQRPEPQNPSTPFEYLSAVRPVRRAPLEALRQAISYLEQSALAAERGLVLVSVPAGQPSPAPRHIQQRLHAVAERHALTMFFGDEPACESDDTLHCAPIPPDSPLAKECIFLLASESDAGAVVARDCGEDLYGEQVFEYVSTQDRPIVMATIRALLDSVGADRSVAWMASVDGDQREDTEQPVPVPATSATPAKRGLFSRNRRK